MGRENVSLKKHNQLTFLTVTLVLNCAALTWLGWHCYSSYRKIQIVIERDLKIEELRGTIVHLDEVLTMSARMAAATGDLQWEQRYRRFEPQLDAAIKEAVRLAPESFSRKAAFRTDAANIKLVEMENSAFDLVRQDRTDQAKALLISKEYETQKRIYSDGMTILSGALSDATTTALDREQRRAFLGIATAVLIAPFLIAGWWVVFRAMHNWNVTLAKKNRTLTEQAEKLADANRRLDQKVAQRTRTLEAQIIDRKKVEQQLEEYALAIESQNKAVEEFCHASEQANEKLKESENRVRSIINSASDAVITLDELGTIESFNPAAERIFGFEVSEIIGKKISLLMPETHAGKYGQFLAFYTNNEKTRTSEFRREVTGKNKNGTAFPLELTVGEFLLQGRRVLTAYLRDLTERKQAEQRLLEMYQQVVEMAHQAGMAEVATDVLHNVGNVLNSINVTTTLISDKLRRSEVTNLNRATAMIEEHLDDLSEFIFSDPKGKHLPKYLISSGKTLQREKAELLEDIQHLAQNIEHIKIIISMQQSFTGSAGLTEMVPLDELLDDAIQFNSGSFEKYAIQIVREYEDRLKIQVEKHKLLQIVVNLIKNAKESLVESGTSHPKIAIRLKAIDDGRLRIDIADNGLGIATENLTKVFSHGFTTKQYGHGFGLHSCANSARQMGGSLKVQSDGLGKGAIFSIELPMNPVQVAV